MVVVVIQTFTCGIDVSGKTEEVIIYHAHDDHKTVQSKQFTD